MTAAMRSAFAGCIAFTRSPFRGLYMTSKRSAPVHCMKGFQEFALDELLARIRALGRRGDDGAKARGVLRFLDISLDRDAMECRRGDRLIPLTRTEYSLLELFIANPRKVLPRDVIFDRVWGYDFGPDSNSLDVYVGYLRRKLEQGGEPRVIQTVRGVGYVMKEP